MDMSRHDADFAFARRDDSRTIWPDQARSLPLKEVARANHVESWDAFGDANDEFDSCLCCFHDRISRIWRRNEDHCCVGARLATRFVDGVEDVDSFVFDSALARR